MCLKEFHIFTFTNREALDRLVRKLWAKYGNKSIKGIFHRVTLSHPDMGEDIWNSFTYNELMEMKLTKHWFKAEPFTFHDWKNYKKTISRLRGCQFVFGKIEVEIR